MTTCELCESDWEGEVRPFSKKEMNCVLLPPPSICPAAYLHLVTGEWPLGLLKLDPSAADGDLEGKGRRLSADHGGYDRNSSVPSDSIKLICLSKIRPRNHTIRLLSWDHTKRKCPSCIVGSMFIARDSLCLSWGRLLLVGSTSKHVFSPDVSRPWWGFRNTTTENACSRRYFRLQDQIGFLLLGEKMHVMRARISKTLRRLYKQQ